MNNVYTWFFMENSLQGACRKALPKRAACVSFISSQGKYFRGMLMSFLQFTARRLVSQAYCGLKASSSKKQKFCLEMARPSSSKEFYLFALVPCIGF